MDVKIDHKLLIQVGIPESVRPLAWPVLIGNSLNLTNSMIIHPFIIESGSNLLVGLCVDVHR